MYEQYLKNEKQLVESLKKGDFEAFDKLFYFYNQRLYHFSLSILKDSEDACDVVQEVFLRIWMNRGEIDDRCSFKSFLFTISYNFIVDIMRKRVSDRNFREQLLRNASNEGSPVESEVEFNELNTLYHTVIEELPPQRKKIYKLHRFEHLNYEEIAVKMGLSSNTVRSQMNKALTYIKTRIGTKTLVALLFLALYT